MSITVRWRGRWSPAARGLTHLVILLAPVVAAGCGAAMQSKPFDRFATAMQETQSGMDEAIYSAAEWSREAFLADITSDPEFALHTLRMTFGSAYQCSLPDPPVYFAFQLRRSDLYHLNAALVQYAELLRALADEQLFSTDTFDMMSQELNDDVHQVLVIGRVDAEPGPVALISIGTVELFRNYLETKRESALREAIETNQETFAHVTRRCIQLIQMARSELRASYTDRFDALHEAWSAATASKREKLVRQIVDLNDACLAAMRILETLEHSYTAMPVAHAELARAIEGQEADLAATQRLFATAARLKRLYGELRASGEAFRSATRP